jgi:hypothetical protein
MGSRTESSHFQQVIEAVESLPPDEQMLLIDIIRQHLIEQRRAEIADSAQNTLMAVREGRARFGTLEDLQRDLESEE